jgi:hypothetical protein
MNTQKKFLLGCQIIVLLYLGYCIDRYYKIDQLVATHSPQKFVIDQVNCHGRYRSVDIVYSKGSAHISYNRDCKSLQKGDLILLYYSEKFDFFHIPGSKEYRNTIWGLVGFLIWSIVPWNMIYKLLWVSKSIQSPPVYPTRKKRRK